LVDSELDGPGSFPLAEDQVRLLLEVVAKVDFGSYLSQSRDLSYFLTELADG
jgi:hypothetical protein